MLSLGDKIWLRESHPNFFLIYVATTFFHIATGITNLTAPGRFFSSSSLTYVNAVAHPKAWGIGFLIVGIFLALGLWQNTFAMARWSLAVGGCLVIIRGTLIFTTVLTGEIVAIGGIWVWFLAGAIHLSQIAEPPINPVTQR